jgi:hypothetical protein
MANAQWGKHGSGNWNTAQNWNTGTVPGAGDSAFIPRYSGVPAYTVTITTAVTVNRVTVDGTNTLAIETRNPASPASLTATDTVTTHILAVDNIDLDGGSTVTINLYNSGLDGDSKLAIGNPYLAAPTTVTMGHTAVLKSIDIRGNAPAEFQAALILQTTAAPTIWSTYSLTVRGDALVSFASGSIQQIINGNVLLDGPSARIANAGDTTSSSALAGLTNVMGVLELLNGAAVATTVSLTNDADIFVDRSGQGGSSLVVGGPLTNLAPADSGINGGEITVGNAAQGTHFEATAFSNGGLVSIGGGSQADPTTVQIHGATSNTGTITLGAYAQLASEAGTKNTASITLSSHSLLADVTEFKQTVDGTLALGGGTLQAHNLTLGGLVHGQGTLDGKVAVKGDLGETFLDTIGPIIATGKLKFSGGTLQSLIDATGTGTAGTVNASGLTLSDATLRLNILHPSNLVTGEIFTLVTFTPGKLTGTFDTIQDGSLVTHGSTLDLGNGHSVEVHYNNAGGVIYLEVIDTPPARHGLDAAHDTDWTQSSTETFSPSVSGVDHSDVFSDDLVATMPSAHGVAALDWV